MPRFTRLLTNILAALVASVGLMVVAILLVGGVSFGWEFGLWLASIAFGG